MWKKILIITICLISGITITYINNISSKLSAQSAPSFQLPKGAKVVLGKYNNNEIVWDIGNNNNNGGYVLMSSKPIKERVHTYDSSIASTCQIDTNVSNYCPLTMINQELNNIVLSNLESNSFIKPPYIPTVTEVKNGGSLGLTIEDRAYRSGYDFVIFDGKIALPGSYSIIHPSQISVEASNLMSTSRDIIYTDLGDGNEISRNDEGIMHGASNATYMIRPYAILERVKVNFAADTSYTDGSWHTYQIDTSNLNANNEDNPVKLRLQSNLTANFNDYKSNSVSTRKAWENSTVQLSVNANAGSNTRISALLYNENGNELKYYKMLSATQNGTNDYDLDLTGIPLGKYQIAVLNEEYISNSNLPVESSPISNVLPLEITKSYAISYKKTPQSGASNGNEYEFEKNVNAGQIIGKITVNPQGVMPLTYTLESNGDNSYQNFEIDELNSSTSSATSLNVNIKSNAPDLVNGSLKAGNYKFCVNSTDANGLPTAPSASTKVCTNFIVAKSDTVIAFDDPNQTKKSITDAGTSWNETATANPTTDTKVTYSVSGGDVSLVHIDSDTGAITYQGGNAYGSVKIKAEVDDADPNEDNYNSAFVEKEIVIYREVDGNVTPHSNSSNTNTPTFTTSDANVRANGIIGTIHGTMGTPDTIGGNTTTYTYGIKSGVGSANFFSVDPNTGVIKTTANSLGVNSYSITVTVSDHWSTKEIPVTVNVGIAAAEELKFYENSSSTTAITAKTANISDTNISVYATVRNSSNHNPVTYRIEDGSTNVIEVNSSSGAITIHGAGSVVIIAEKQGVSGQANASARLTFTVTAGEQNFIYTDQAGNEMPNTNHRYDVYEEVYDVHKTFRLYTSGNPPGSDVTYQLKAGSPTDVISVDPNGLVTVLNASLNTQIGRVIVEAISHDPSGNYNDSTIELPINIKKANQTISFQDITHAINGRGSVTPIINEQDISSNNGGVTINDTDYYITIDNSISSTVAWTNNGVDIEYNYSGTDGLDIPLHVEKAGNRNYNRAEADGMMRIMGPDESTLAINRPGQIIYGDHFTIRSLQDDSSSTNVQYQFEVDSTTYISNPTINGNQATFDALKASGSTQINIKVTRTADGETALSKTIHVQVLPKPIEIKIDDKEKYKGEQNPSLTYQEFRSQLVSWNGIQDVIQENDINISTAADTNSNAGSYPIKGNKNILNTTYPNYSFTYKEGTLTVKEDNIEDDWYHLEIENENHTAYTGNWINKDVNIVSDHSEYKNLSLDQSTWRTQKVTVTKEGETNQSFWLKKDSGATTKAKQEIIKIDKTAPKVKGIKAKDTNNNIQNMIHQLTGGIFFKPGTAFEITTDDSKDDLKVSGTKEIAYKVYKTENQARSGEELIKEGSLTVNNEKASVTISETVGKYKVCIIPKDNAGNTNTESCHEVELKKIDVDIDGDSNPDFNDSDKDGCLDLNIKWKDPNDDKKWIVINGDRNNDSIPDLNIDSDGDGKPDLNIDTDHDSKPDLNFVILKKSDWKPTKCVKVDTEKGILEEYCTGTSVKALINIDTNNDEIPDINIDNKGDFKPHLNISTDGKTPQLNIVKLHEWKPDKNYQSNKFTYDSIGEDEAKREINIDTDGDGLPDVNVDLDDDGIPDINIDNDGDEIPNVNIDSNGDGKPDFNIDVSGNGYPEENLLI